MNIYDDIESDPDDPEETSSEEDEDLLDSSDEEDMEGAGQGEVSNQDVLYPIRAYKYFKVPSKISR